MPYASVAAYDTTKTHIIAGTTSDSTGAFVLRVPPGTFRLQITFLSFESYIRLVEVAGGERLHMGRITLKPATEELNEVVVEGERAQMELYFDKRVFRVGKDLTTTGTTALDVLGNVPSVTTDIKGNVSLRGSQAVRILINGAPSNTYRNGSLALRSLPAHMIEEVQVITNPSARYDAEGAAGIINIILKKQEDRGFNGSVTAGAGLPANHEVGSNLNYRAGRVNWFLNTGVMREEDRPFSRSFQRYDAPDTSYAYRERTTGVEGGYLLNLRGGADLHLTDSQTLTVSAGYFAEFKKDWFDGLYTDLAADGQVVQRTRHHEVIGGGERAFEAVLEYENLLDGEDHQLTAEASFEYGREPELPHITETPLLIAGDTLSQRIEDVFTDRQWLVQMEYVRPLGEDMELEAGLRSAINDLGRTYRFEEKQEAAWKSVPAFTNNYAYFQNVNAVYATYSAERKPFSFQAGLRVEQVRLRTRLKATNQRGRQAFIDLFPSAFLTYMFNDRRSIQVSYSRRIFRPSPWLLLPFTTYRSSRSRFTGNPDLQPEFGNSYEAGFLQYWSTGSLLTSVYHRHRTGVVERVTTLDAEGISRQYPINLSTENAWGLELTAEQNIAERLKLTGTANLFKATSNGTYQDQALTSETRTLNGRLGATWQIMDGWKGQASLRYRGPAHTSQGRRAAYHSLDIGTAKDLFDGKATVSFNVQDVFEGREEAFTVQDRYFYSYRIGRETTRAFRVNVLYRINQAPGAEESED